MEWSIVKHDRVMYDKYKQTIAKPHKRGIETGKFVASSMEIVEYGV